MAHRFSIFKGRRRPVLFVALGVSIALLVGSIIALYLVSQPSAQSPNGRKKTIDLLTKTNTQTQQRRITSQLGFSLEYDPGVMTAEGIVQNPNSEPGTFQGQTYNGDQLQEARNYGIITLHLTNKTSSTPQPAAAQQSQLTITANRNKNYFGSKDSIPEYKGKSNLDIITQEKRKSLAHAGRDDEINERAITIADKKYRELHVKHRLKALNGQLTIWRQSYYYLTVQHDRPYWLAVTNLPANDRDALTTWQNVISRVSYTQPQDGALSSSQPVIARLAAANRPTDTANIHGTVGDDIMLSVVAKNQLATVRVGAMRCARLTFRVQSNTLTLAKACNGGIGSGSIVSSDGVVVTNGHVVETTDTDLLANAFPTSQQEWDNYVQFVTGAGYATETQIRELISQVENDDMAAAQKLIAYLQLVPKSNITVSNSRTDYVIQTSDDPIRLTEENTWQKSATNKTATLIDKEVDTGDVDLSSRYTDVALLKMSGTFPTIQQLSSLSSVQNGDRITAVGYPALVDGGISTKQSRTIPTVSTGTTSRTLRDGGGHSLILTTTEISSGSSGGPAFNAKGEQVGITTYARESCTKEESCFGSGIARDAQDAQAMAAKQRVSITTNGELTKLWQMGIDEFVAGRYSTAARSFSSLNSKYPGNYLVTKFLSTAQNQPRDETDQTTTPSPDARNTDPSTNPDTSIDYSYTPLTSSEHSTIVILIICFMVIVVIAIAVIGFAIWAGTRKKNSTQPRYPYPLGPTAQPGQPPVGYTSQPQPPVQQPYYPPQSQPQPYPPAQQVTPVQAPMVQPATQSSSLTDPLPPQQPQATQPSAPTESSTPAPFE